MFKALFLLQLQMLKNQLTAGMRNRKSNSAGRTVVLVLLFLYVFGAFEFLFYTYFMNNKNVLFNVREECVIHPRIVLRFVKGIDATDVLLSSPCYSFTVYYPGSVNVFNAKPAAKVIDALINTLDKNQVDFVSPALLNQLLPVGVPQTKEQRDLVSKKPKAIKNWEVKKHEEKPKEKTEPQGWNNLDLGF